MVNYMNEAGKHHNYNKMNNQDAVIFRNDNRFDVLILADGVSTCSRSGDGSRIVSERISEYLLQHGERIIQLKEREIKENIVSCALGFLEEESAKTQIDIDEYSSTLAFVLVDKKQNIMLYFNLGDGMIMAVKENACSIIAMPSDSRNGCCVTTTYGAAEGVETGILKTNDIKSVVIYSDGAWNIMYRNGKLEPDIREALLSQNFAGLKEILSEKERFDDCSFISVDLNIWSGRSLV